MACMVVLTAVLGRGIGQQTSTSSEFEVTQLAMQIAEMTDIEVTDVPLKSGPTLKFKRELHNAKLAKW